MILELISFLVSVGLTTWGSLSWWSVTSGLDFYKPIVMLIGFYIAGLAFWFGFIGLVGILFERNPKKHNMGFTALFFVQQVIEAICFHGLCRVKVTGKDKLPKNERYLYVCNHISNFDPLVSYAYLKQQLGFITKPTNMTYPLARHFLPLVNFQPINRDDPLQSLEVMKHSIDLITNNVTSVAVYPEGTRHKDCVLGDFHEGVFTIATRSKCPIVVSTIKGTNLISKHMPFKPTKIVLDIIDVIYPDAFEGKTVKAISDEVKNKISAHLAK